MPRDRGSPDRVTPVTIKTDQDREPGEIVSEPSSATDQGDPETVLNAATEEIGEDPSWDERTIFPESPLSSKVDPIAAPLPTQYSDDVMIPPAFDAKALKSRYITPRNIDDFAQSIRETRDWQVMQHHPAFLDPLEIHPRKLDDYDRAVQKDISMKNNRRDRSSNLHDTSRHRHGNSKGSGRHHGKSQEPRYKSDQKKRRWSDFYGDVDGSMAERHRDFPYDDPYNKKPRPTSPEPGEVIEGDSQSTYEPPETTLVPLDDTNWDSEAIVVKDTKLQRFTVGNRGNEYQEMMNQRVNHLSPEDQETSKARSPTPPTYTADTPQPQSRPSSRLSSRSFQEPHPSSRRSSLASSRPDSPLDSIERELLGLEGPSPGGSDAGGESPKRQFNDATPKLKRRQPTHAAYSRRW